MIQIMSMYESPNIMCYTYSNHDINVENINWSEIKKHKHSITEYQFGQYCQECNATSDAHTTLARIIRQNGLNAGSTYESYIDEIFGIEMYRTGTKPINVINTINSQIKVQPYKQGNTFKKLFEDLDDTDGAAIVVADIDNEDIKDGHMWIADGSKKIYYEIKYMVYDVFTKEYREESTKKITDTKLIHFNWCDGGDCNGWFNINAINESKIANTSSADEYDYPNLDNGRTGNSAYRETLLEYWLYKNN